MSTAIDYALRSSTVGAGQEKDVEDMYGYRIGRSGTDPSSAKDPELKPRSSRRSLLISDIDSKVEAIKQTWNGIVTECDDEELTARLEDLTNPENPDEIVVLSREEVEQKDQPLIRPGAIFLWHIGYRYGHRYPRERFSKISFRRLPRWTDRELQEAEEQAQEYADFFNADPTNTP